MRVEQFFRSRLRLSQIRLLVAIDQAAQLRHVAQMLCVTPSAISKQIAEIESALDQAIVHRVGNQVQFTELGALLARRSKDLLGRIEMARIEVDDLISGATRTIGLGIVPSIASLFLPPLVEALKAVSPNTTIKLFEGHYAQLAPMLKEGVIAFALARETAHPFSLDFVESQIMTDPLKVVCAAKFLPRSKRALEWADLRSMPWIFPARGLSMYVHTEALLFRNGLTLPPGSIESSSRAATADLLQIHPFVALLPYSYVRPHLESGKLVDLQLSTDGMLGNIKAIWRRGDDNSLVTLLHETARAKARTLEQVGDRSNSA